MMNDNPRDAEMWIEAFQAKFEGKGRPFERKDWDQLLGHCQAVTDTPCAVFYRELLEAYPDAKVILTVRDSPQQWWDSQMRTIMPFFEKLSLPPRTWTASAYRLFMPPETAFSKVNYMLPRNYEMYKLLAEDMHSGSRKALGWYEDYCAEIQRIVPKEKLLVMNIKEGWEPLCKFLGDETPPWAFPAANSSTDFYHNIGEMNQLIDQGVYWSAAKRIATVAVLAAAAGLAYLSR
ncbi:hypothetical protein LTR85_004171 [Meristemomyces frigidus]|nr:hypothetical protein LTR85_004171 [Meristemomyces frigidus]